MTPLVTIAPASPGSVKQILKSTPLLAMLDEAELSSLAARCGIHSYTAGEILFSEGEPCKGLYIVVEGRIRIFKTSVNGREHVLAVEGPGASCPSALPVDRLVTIKSAECVGCLHCVAACRLIHCLSLHLGRLLILRIVQIDFLHGCRLVRPAKYCGLGDVDEHAYFDQGGTTPFVRA
jgi:hypothetical protein